MIGSGGVPKLMKMLANVTGGLGKMVVNCGIHDAAVGDVALPVSNCGWVKPATDGGTGAGLTLRPTVNDGSGEKFGGGNAGVPEPKVGGGNFGVPLMGIGGAGSVAEPLSNTGCSIPSIDGGTGAGSIGNDICYSKARAWMAQATQEAAKPTWSVSQSLVRGSQSQRLAAFSGTANPAVPRSCRADPDNWI